MLEETILQYQRQVRELELQRKKNQDVNQLKKQAYLDEFNLAVNALEEFMKYKLKQLSNFDSEVERSKQETITLSEADQAMLLLS